MIKIFESKPLSIIVKKNKKYILDSSAKLISFDKKNIINNDLPMVFGENAEKNFLNFYNLLKDNDFPKDKIKNYFYFQVDRWDLQLKNNKIIKFPSSKIKDSIKLSIKLLNRQDFINYNVIDLRIHGKIVAE